MSALSLGAGLAFLEGFDGATDHGYVPGALCGNNAGFESLIEHRDESWLLYFETRCSNGNYAAAAAVASSLALVCGDRLRNDGAPSVGGDQLLEWYRAVELPAGSTDTEVLRIQGRSKALRAIR